ncbi:hypothetical protein [Falsiroseomonas oryziterrae]|uniref:hypothetical protein n=1 Tax=Falsiroseomonas oryziterrae TaxID=2911368 RepID=UPI001F1BC785|nr:hypothetical protein [Roseomonas sp. NPKOSM-4]
MRKILLPFALATSLSACATVPQTQFIPSTRSAVELRAVQVRSVPADADTTMRGVIAALHDMGYRITRVEPDARTVSATRQTTLRMAVVVQPRGPNESTVRANATLIAPMREAQVDSAEFYQRNFFEPLGATLGRTPVALAATEAAPDAPRPVAELNTAREREAASRPQGLPSTPATGTLQR